MKIIIKESGNKKIKLRVPSAFLTSPTMWKMYVYIANKGIKKEVVRKNLDDLDEFVDIEKFEISKESAEKIANAFMRVKKTHGEFKLLEVIDYEDDDEITVFL